MKTFLKINRPIFAICILILGIQIPAYSITTQEILKLKEKGYTTKQIQDYIRSQQPTSQQTEKANEIEFLKRHVSYIEESTWMKNYRLEKFSIDFLRDRIEVDSTHFHSMDIGNKYHKNIVIPYSIFNKIEVDTYSIKDYAVKLPIIFIFTETKKAAYRIKIRTKKLHVIYLYIKAPECYNYNIVSDITNHLEHLKTISEEQRAKQINLNTNRVRSQGDHQLNFGVFRNFLGMEFSKIPSGNFIMGGDNDYPNEIQHKVKISSDFALQRTEVTIQQWNKFVNETGYKTEGHKTQFDQNEDHPITNVSQEDALSFINWLKSKEGINYSLPTEAQWEYACRSGTRTPFFFGSKISFSNIAIGHKGTIEVQKYPPNFWGLYDMHGNVYEWCLDRGIKKIFNLDFQGIFTETYANNVIDPKSSKGDQGVIRGGSWRNGNPKFFQSGHRSSYPLNGRRDDIGFRVAINNISNINFSTEQN